MGEMRERLATGVRGLSEAISERANVSLVERDRLTLLESRDREAGALRRELDALAWTALNYAGGRPQDLKPAERLKLVQKARVVWMKDPQAGAAVDLMNDFTFGRGLPKPKANDELVQEILDEAWDDPDNQEALTAYQAQLELGIDLSLQSNLFFLVFDDGDDGKVKLAMLNHDTVEGVVRDPENRKRVLFYIANEPEEQEAEWDFVTDQPKLEGQRKPMRHVSNLKYYEHWRNMEQAEKDFAERKRDKLPERPPAEKAGEGKVFHIAINKTGEMVFGHPRFDRLIGWFNAYNRFMDARVDIMEASAAFVMKRKVKGTPNQLAKQATQALSRRSALGMTGVDPLTGEPLQPGPKAASILNENEEVTWEDFNINTNAQNAQADAQMIRSQIASATRFPQSYYGDASNSNLATATSLELPVLKAVENFQEIFERIVRFFVDRVIEKAVDAKRIPTELTPEERDALAAKKDPERQSGGPPQGPIPPQQAGMNGTGQMGFRPPLALAGAHEDAVEDEEDTERDLGYKFQMPNPLKRMLTDLVTAVQTIARTFDPNNTNMELSRTLLEIALAEGMEVEDPAGMVEKIFPEGYVDPAVAAMQAQMAGGMPPPDGEFGEFGPSGSQGADGQRHQAGNPYGAPMRSQLPMNQSIVRPLGRDGEPVDPRVLMEARRRTAPPAVAAAVRKRRLQVDREFDAQVLGNGDGRR